jgi:hypothetical protein
MTNDKILIQNWNEIKNKGYQKQYIAKDTILGGDKKLNKG